MEAASLKPGPLDEFEKAVPDSFEQIGAELLELLPTDLGVQVQVVSQALDDDGQRVTVGRHLTFYLLRQSKSD